MMLQCYNATMQGKGEGYGGIIWEKIYKQNPFYADVHRRSRFFPDG